jgi:hypothetical protein
VDFEWAQGLTDDQKSELAKTAIHNANQEMKVLDQSQQELLSKKGELKDFFKSSIVIPENIC